MKVTKSKPKYVLRRHKIYNKMLKVLIRPFLFLAFNYRIKNKYKISKGESVVVMSNHQTDLDPILIEFSFNKHLYPVGTDTIFHGLGGKLLRHCFGAIAKRKGEADIAAVASMNEAISEGGSILFFPEGNRSYAEFQFFISENLPMMLKNFKSTIVLFNLHGGTGTYPRWKDKHKRKGKFYGEVHEVLKYEDYKDIPNDILLQRIKDGIKVFDSESGERYKSEYRAEQLERMLFVCPKCGTHSHIRSEKDQIICDNCGLHVTFTEDLHLESEDKDFDFHILNDWYQYQKKWLLNYEVKPDSKIFEDKNITAYIADPYTKRREIYSGKVILTDKEIILGTKKFDLSGITSASALSGNRFSFTHKDHQYMVVGLERFNPLKYVLAFHRLDTALSRGDLEQYYKLED